MGDDGAKAALERAFAALLRERGYDGVTVGDVVARAGVGRSTFYRHYDSKADLLLSLHASAFARLDFGYRTRADWLADAPPPGLLTMFQNAGMRAAFTTHLYRLGKDVDYIQREMQERIAAHVETLLRRAFDGATFRVPPPVLAHALAGLLVRTMQWWAAKQPGYAPEAFAAYLHRLVRAVVREGVGER